MSRLNLLLILQDYLRFGVFALGLPLCVLVLFVSSNRWHHPSNAYIAKHFLDVLMAAAPTGKHVPCFGKFAVMFVGHSLRFASSRQLYVASRCLECCACQLQSRRLLRCNRWLPIARWHVSPFLTLARQQQHNWDLHMIVLLHQASNCREAWRLAC